MAAEHFTLWGYKGSMCPLGLPIRITSGPIGFMNSERRMRRSEGWLRRQVTHMLAGSVTAPWCGHDTAAVPRSGSFNGICECGVVVSGPGSLRQVP